MNCDSVGTMLGTGFHWWDPSSNFIADAWLKNTLACGPFDELVVVTTCGMEPYGKCATYIHGYNIGYSEDTYNHRVCGEQHGWPATIVLLLMLSYVKRMDLIFKEQDCFAWGDWVGHLREVSRKTGADLLVGPALGLPFGFSASNSLLYAKWPRQAEIVRLFESYGPSIQTPAEMRFGDIRTNYGWAEYHGLGPERDRPLPIKSKLWSAQHFSETEIDVLDRAGLL